MWGLQNKTSAAEKKSHGVEFSCAGKKHYALKRDLILLYIKNTTYKLSLPILFVVNQILHLNAVSVCHQSFSA